MYFSNVTVPLMTPAIFAQLEKVAPGITSFNGMKLITNEAEALEFASQQLQDVLNWNESVGGVESLTTTATGWDIKLRVLESQKDRLSA